MFNPSFILQSTPSMLMQWGPLVFIMFVIYFLMIRPQAKKQKEQNNFLSDLKKGDRVATGSGIVGKITKMDGKTTQLQVDGKNYLEVVTTTISKEMTDYIRGEEK